MAVMTFTSREFRNRQGHVFDLADKGNNIIIRRRNRQAYRLVPVEEQRDDNVITPELQAKIDKAREEYRRGETLHFDSIDEIHKWMDEL